MHTHMYTDIHVILHAHTHIYTCTHIYTHASNTSHSKARTKIVRESAVAEKIDAVETSSKCSSKSEVFMKQADKKKEKKITLHQ